MFKGAYTAMVTPFDENGQVDYGTIEELVERQVAGGVDGLVPVGTTGESPTLSFDEHLEVIRVTLRAADGRVKVIAGSGANSTAEALQLTRLAKEAGADGSLQITPYYNKPNQEGLFRHFSAVADLGLPIVLYNVPGRTALEIGLDTVERLAEHENIVAIKEAGGSLDRVGQILQRCDLTVLSGDDSLSFPMMAVGAQGVISVASNVLPEHVARMVHAVLAGRWDDARLIHEALFPLFKDLFIDTNPIPVKAAMAMQGVIQETYRLPLCPMAEALRVRLYETLKDAGAL